MDNQLSYRQARTIRNRSVSDLIADEMIRGKGLGGAIGGAISLRTKARMKGIREKFDILNMVRAVTGKSRLATSIIGRLFGRSREDIEYFAGRASPIGEKRKKVTGLSGQGEGEDTSGMKVVLNQILTFLQKSHEKDMVLREKENNLREGAKLKDDKRHTDLLKALANVGFGGTGETATKEKEGGLLDGIMSIINGLKQQLQSFIDDLKDVTKWFKMIGSSGLSILGRILTFFAGGLGAALLGVASIAALWFLGQQEAMKSAKARDEAAAKGDLDTLRKQVEANTGASEGGEIGSVDDRMKSLLKAVNTPESRAALAKLESGTDPNSDAYRKKVEQSLEEQGYSKDFMGKWKKRVGNEFQSPTAEAMQQANAFASGVKQTPATPAPAPTPAPSPAPAPVPPPAVNEAPKSSAVNTATDTNVSLNLSTTTSAEKNQAAQNRTNVINNKAATGQKVPMHMVRNKEETFQRMIYNSLRLV